MLARLMTRQTLLEKRRHVALRTMDVVARRARHARARAKTLRALQQRHLIPVDVGGRRRVRGRGEIVVELVTRSVGERRNFWVPLDRKSTRLNSSHRCISYAVFCLKKKT